MNNHVVESVIGKLNGERRVLLQDAILAHGNVVTFEQLRALMPKRGEGEVLRIASELVKSGWLVRISKGLYEIADLASLGTLTLARPVIAQLLHPGSYVTDENALQYHGLHDQLMDTFVSASLTRHRTVEVQGTTYRFLTVKESFFYGFEEVTLGGYAARIAYAEKALIDMIQIRRGAYAVDRVAEVLAYSDAIDLARLAEYLERASLSTVRIFGFILNALELPVDERLVVRANSSDSNTYLTVESAVRNSRWRLYYEPRLLKRIVAYKQI